MLDLFISGAVIAAIVSVGPRLWKLGKQKKAEAISNGEIYYGLLYCRVLLLYLAGVISGEMILMVLLGNSIEGVGAFLITVISGVPFAILYTRLYERRFEKRFATIETEQIQTKDIPLSPNITDVNITKPTDNTPSAKLEQPLNRALFCRKCGAKLFDDSEFCHKCGTGVMKEDGETREKE